MSLYHPFQVMELQSTCAEKEQLLSERSIELQEKTFEIRVAEENISAVTEEKDKLLQGVREERDQLKREQLEKSEMVSEGSCSLL